MQPRHVYVHVPFCRRRCSYCDFAIAVRSRVPVDEYLASLARELDLRAPVSDGRAVIDTLYLGGGTPSRLGGEGVAAAVRLLRGRYELAPDAEVTVEANPEDVSPESVAAWRDAGVNRISLGSQSFDERVLAWMHRTHTSGQIERAVDAIRGAGIHNFSLDLIFAVPAELERSWENDLARAVALEPAHLSFYGLTIEPATPLARWRDRGELVEADEDRYAGEFLHAHDVLAGAGYDHYEVSNFARPGGRSRHNSSYWSGAPYVGLGPSAHAFDGGTRRWNEAAYVDWVRLLATTGDPTAGEELLTDDNRVAEGVYLGLRTTGGVDVAPDERARVGRWVDAGWATLHGDRLRLTPLGWLRLDSLAADLTLSRSRSYI